MDNGAYEKYLKESPDVNVFTSTDDHITMFPEKLTNEEIVVLGSLYGTCGLCTDQLGVEVPEKKQERLKKPAK